MHYIKSAPIYVLSFDQMLMQEINDTLEEDARSDRARLKRL
jgi:hypothetical protein